MKRVCIIHNTGIMGGGTKSFFDVIGMLQEKYEVIACVPKGAKTIIDYLVKKNIHIYEIESNIPIFPYYSGGSSFFSPSFVKEILLWKKGPDFAAEIVKLKPDLLIFNSVIMAVSGAYFPSDLKKVCIIRETFKQTIWDKLYKKWLNENFSGVCSIAESELTYLNLLIPTVVIPDFYEVDQMKDSSIELAKKKKDFQLLYLGGLDFIKGPDIAIESLKFLPDDCRLICAGHFDIGQLSAKSILKIWTHPRLFWNRLKIKYYLNQNTIRRKIEFVGFCQNVSSLFQETDVVIFPSNVPHQLRPGIEAGNFSKPVILSDFPATREYFKNGYNALTFTPHNAKKLAESIYKLYEDSNLREQLGRNNREATLRLHHKTSIQNKLLNFLEEVIHV